MNDNFFSGSLKNYKSKIKEKNITPNTKITQNQEKIKKLHKSPMNPLNKKLFDINLKKIRNKNPLHLNRKNIFHNIKNINFINKTNLKIYPLIYNNRNNTKANLLSNYFSKTINKIENNLRKNHSNKNLINITNSDNDNFNKPLKNNMFYPNKSNINNLKKHSLIKTKDILNNEDLSMSKKMNKNSLIYPFIGTEESKKNIMESIDKLKPKKIENSFNIFYNFSSKKLLKQRSISTLIKQNLTLNNIQNKSEKNILILNQKENSLKEEKNNKNYYTEDNYENKLINKLKELKNYKNNEIIDKIKVIIEETIENLLPKKVQKIIKLLFKEIFNINKHYLDNINHLKEIIQKFKIKIIHYEKYFKDLINKLKNKEKDLNDLKKEIEDFQKEKKKFENYKNSQSNINKKMKKYISLNDNNNSFIQKLNKKNVDDLEALYFPDKINYIQSEAEQNIPKLNLEQNFIDKCIKKEFIKRSDINLSPFQKIALQFEMI